MLSTYCTHTHTFSSAAVAAGPSTHLREARATRWSESFDRRCWRLTVTSGCVTADLCRRVKSDFVVCKRTEHMLNVPVTVSETSSQFWSRCLFSVCLHCFHTAFAADFVCTLPPTPIATDGNWMRRTRRSILSRPTLSLILVNEIWYDFCCAIGAVKSLQSFTDLGCRSGWRAASRWKQKAEGWDRSAEDGRQRARRARNTSGSKLDFH